MAAAWVATSALRSFWKKLAKIADTSGPVAPTSMVAKASTMLARPRPSMDSRSMPGIFAQVSDEDEAAEHQLQQRVGQLHDEKDAADGADHAAGDERRGHIHAHEWRADARRGRCWSRAAPRHAPE